MAEETTCRFSSDRVCDITGKLCIHEDPAVCEHLHTAYELGCKRGPFDKPPVDVGDTVYLIDNGTVYKATVISMSIQWLLNHTKTEIVGAISSFHRVSRSWNAWGTSIFGSEAEATNKLQGG